jgi:Zinc-finger of C2H2 type
MRSSEYNYFEAILKELKIHEWMKKEKDEEIVYVDESEVEESGQEAMETDENQEVEVAVPVNLKAEPKKSSKCTICHKTFASKKTLKIHFESVHEKKTFSTVR